MVKSQSVNFSIINSLAEEAAKLEYSNERDESKEELWTRMGENLEIQNYPKHEIAKKIRSLIETNLEKILIAEGMDEHEAKKEAKLKSGHFYRVMSAKDWTDKTFAHNKTDEPLPQGNDINSSTKLNENSPHYDERYDDIILIRKMKKFLDMIEDQLEVDHDEIKDDSTGNTDVVERDWSQFYTKDRIKFHDFLKNTFANFFDEWSRQLSKKQSLLPKMWIVSSSIMGCGVGISDFCANYYALVKNKTQISPKALKKFMTEVNNYSDYMQFIQDDAWKWNVLPIACPKCTKKTLKTRIRRDGSWEFICTNKKAHKDDIQPHFTPNLFRKQLERFENQRSKIGQSLVDEIGIVIKENNPVNQ